MATERVQTLIERYVTGSWSSITNYVVGDIEGESLIATNEPTDLLAMMGEVTLVMNNESGDFSPNSAFKRGTPIRIITTYDGIPKTKFKGTILDIDPDTLEWGDQYSRVTVVDWMHFAINFPLIVPSIQTNMKVQEAVAYLLSIIDQQPDSVTYHSGRETFEFVFDTVKEQTRLYSELNKLALSENAPIYIRSGNELVVESANTRHGQRTLTEIPVAPSQLEAILTDPNGGLILVAEGTQFAILADRMVVPNMASGTVRPMTQKLIHGEDLINQVSVKAYPVRYDELSVPLFELDAPIQFPANSRRDIRGTWADPDGGNPINSFSVLPQVTGTDYQFFQLLGDGQEYTSQLLIKPIVGAEGFVYRVFTTTPGWLTKFVIRGVGIYPYNPVQALVAITGSVSEYGNSYLEFSQKYQDDLNVGERIAETIADDYREPITRVTEITFDASSSPEFMQASQCIDIGDLTYVRNIKPPVDSYAYVQGKKWKINIAGVVTETWYLKEMDSVRKGLSPIALKFSGLLGSANSANFGLHSTHNVSGAHTWACWFWMQDGASSAPLISKTDVDASGNDSSEVFIDETQIFVLRAFKSGGVTNTGLWTSPTGTLTGLENSWHHMAMVYDDSSVNNDPLLYLDGVSLPLHEADTPEGMALDYSGANLIIGNVNVAGAELPYQYNGYIKDVRIYNRLLTPQEVAQLASNHNDYLTVTNGLVFQAPFVKTEDYGGMTGTVILPTQYLIDNIYGVRGTVTGILPSGTLWNIRAYDPNF